ncbi:hypothetical protein DMB66_18115 [Actinoplanes sp. ATCC 53533]|uniref:hypothetical protein n=1 Tax=Actinoplanes sp. ATCC 53533 TaxID=1288362 RepID=UPI000F77EC49|nr:hypothetical protein [Actinoplanes sp. ATCC 53533]RSM64983.1 hypothetical protein DMB66_18115 [Actinoplanes sp. ATCC 53533]
MSAYEWTSVTVSAIGLLAVIVSLGFVRYQVQIMAQQTERLSHALETSAESALDALFVVVTQAYLEHPTLRPIFNERDAHGALPPLDEDMTYRANAVAETLLDAMERAMKFSDRGLSGASESLNAWILDSFRYSAFLRGWLDAHATWYAPRLTALLAQATKELEASRAASTRDPARRIGEARPAAPDHAGTSPDPIS